MIKINQINLSDIYKPHTIVKSPIFRGTVDSFEKTSKNVSQNDFIKWAQNTSFLKNGLENSLTNPANILGKGFSHIAYTIDGNNDYILRTSNISPNILDFTSAKIVDTEDKELGINIGQQIAEIKVNRKGKYPFPEIIEVLKKQTGESIGIAPNQALYIESTGELREGEKPYEDISRKEKYAKTIHQVAQLPLSAYEELIETIQNAQKKGYVLDHLNSNNLLVDETNQSINIIDMEKKGTKADYGNVLYALTNIYYFETFTSQYDSAKMSKDKINQAFQDTLDIIDKFTQAMKKKQVKFDKDNCSLEFFNFILSMPCSFFCKSFDVNEKWAKLKQMGLA